jgi:hypothetical protein
VPHGHWKTTTFTGGLRLTGLTAPFVHDGPMSRTGSHPDTEAGRYRRDGQTSGA